MSKRGSHPVHLCAQVLEQLKLEPEATMLSSALIDKAGAVHTIVPAGHRIGTPQVACRAALYAACWQHMLGPLLHRSEA